VRAKVLAARGELTQAASLAPSAVHIAAGTDFLDLHATTWLDLAEVLRAAHSPEAQTAAHEALLLYELKGNLTGAARAEAASGIEAGGAEIKE
jgi:hypothetical protein